MIFNKKQFGELNTLVITYYKSRLSLLILQEAFYELYEKEYERVL